MKYKILVYFVIIPLVPFFLADLQLRGKRSESDDVCKETTMKQEIKLIQRTSMGGRDNRCLHISAT